MIVLGMTADPPPASAPACLERAESRAYVAAVKERAHARWELTADDPRANAVVAFRLDEHGRIVSSEVRSASSPPAGEKAKQALAEAAPYPEMPPEAVCLARTKLIARFQAPGTAQAAPPAEEPRRRERPGWSRFPWGFLVGLLVIFGPALARILRRRAQSPDVPPWEPPSASAPSAPPAPGGSEWPRYAVIAAGMLVALALLYWLAP